MRIDFVIIGAHKSGTTWLHKCLEEHPKVCMPQNPPGYSKNKKLEIEFFNDTHMPWRHDQDGASNYKNGLEWYEQFFQHCGNGLLRGESSPVYLHAPEVPERIYAHNPKAKLILLLRDPVTRLFSLYNYTKMNTVGSARLPSTFREFLELPGVIDLSMYHKHIQNYLHFFPSDQLLTLVYEDIANNPETVMRRVYEFLGIDVIPIPAFAGEKINSAESRLIEERNRIWRAKYGRYIAKLLTLKDYFSLPPRVESQELQKEDISFLTDIYRDDVHNLRLFLGRNLSEWVHESLL